MIFCSLMLGMLILDSLTLGHAMAIYASGRIALFSVMEGIAHGLTLILAWVFVAGGYAPPYVVFAGLLTVVGLMIGRVVLARRQLDMPARKWGLEVLLPCLITGLGAAGISYIVRVVVASSFMRLLGVFAVSTLAIVALGWLLVLMKTERRYLTDKFNQHITAAIRSLRPNRNEA
ncbi:MAG: hypothetical protein U1E27_12180 [Kiritimatiellia bacterium]|nr:hypothetical protein [Kiritimatiellia bacterium]